MLYQQGAKPDGSFGKAFSCAGSHGVWPADVDMVTVIQSVAVTSMHYVSAYYEDFFKEKKTGLTGSLFQS